MSTFGRARSEDRGYLTDAPFTSCSWIVCHTFRTVHIWSGYQTLRKQEGEEAAQELLETLLQSCAEILGVKREDVGEVPLKLRTDYWMSLYRK